MRRGSVPGLPDGRPVPGWAACRSRTGNAQPGVAANESGVSTYHVETLAASGDPGYKARVPDVFFQFYCPTKIVFNPGIANDISAELAGLGLSKVLVITDKVLVDLGIVNPVLAGLKNAGVEVAGVFKDVPTNSEIEVIKRCADEAGRLEVDGIVAIGGGSVID